MNSKCAINTKGSGSLNEHLGRSRPVKVLLHIQPSGRGSLSVIVEVKMCDAHRHWFANSHIGASIKDER